MRTVFGAIGFLLVLHGPATLACGHCIEDKVAATYDHRVLDEAQRRGHAIAYVDVTGIAADHPQTAAEVQRFVSHAAGVVGASVRVSAAPPAVSFAWDATRYDLDRILAGLNLQLTPHRLQLSLLRQWDPKNGLR